MDKYTEPDYECMALLTIDLQNDFVLKGAICEITGTVEKIPNVLKILNKFRQKNCLVIHIVRLYKQNGSNVDSCKKKIFEDGSRFVAPYSEGAELVKALKPNEKRLNADKLLNNEIQEISQNEFVIYKPRWGAFYNTPLEKFLKDSAISTLIFTGCNFPNCPRASIYEASERDFRIVVVEDAISGIYKKDIEELKNIGCEILRTKELLKKL